MRLVKSFWAISLVIFLAANLFIYGDGPEIFNLHFDAQGNPDFALKKVHFFYYSITIGLIPNIILMLMGYAIPYLPKEMIFVPNKETWLSADHRKTFYRIADAWIRGFAFILNLFLTLSAFGFYYLNSIHKFPLQWLFYVIAALGIIWLFYSIPLFRKHPEDFE